MSLDEIKARDADCDFHAPSTQQQGMTAIVDRRYLLELNAQLVADIESGFAPGAYARLKELQVAERERDALRELNAQLVAALREIRHAWLKLSELTGRQYDLARLDLFNVIDAATAAALAKVEA